jgi:integrase
MEGKAEARIGHSTVRWEEPWEKALLKRPVSNIVKDSAKRIGVAKLDPHDLRRTCARLCHASGGELEQIQFLLGHVVHSDDGTLSGLQATDLIRGA